MKKLKTYLDNVLRLLQITKPTEWRELKFWQFWEENRM